MKKKIMSIIAAAAMICGVNTALPVNAESPAIVETAAKSFSYKCMTFDEAIKDISGNYVWLSGGKDKATPDWRFNRSLVTLDENNKFHIINIESVVTAIKVEEGTVLPYDDIKAAVEAENLKMPTFRKNGKEYEIISATSREAYDYTLELLKACPEVTAIEMHYKLYEDKNYISLDGAYYSGDMTAAEFTEKYPDFTEQKGMIEGKLYFGYEGYQNNLYEVLRNMQENGDNVDFNYAMTELAFLNPVKYYCNDPVIIDGTMGDANVDGYVDLSDSIMIMQSLANPDKYGISADGGITAQGQVNGDTDGNGLTNNDAREIQMSLLGLGSVPIPQKDDDITLINYDYVDFTDEDNNFTVRVNDTEYINCGATLGLSAIGEEMGEYEVLDREKNGSTGKVFALNDISSELAVAVQYSGSNNYHVYRNMWYEPQTVGQIIDDFDLENTLSINHVYCHVYKPAFKYEKYTADQDYIYNMLFGDRDIAASSSHDDYLGNISQIDRTAENYCELEIGCDIPFLGRYGFGIRVYQNGAVHTNMVERGTTFNIGAEKAQELIEKYSPKS